MHCNDQNYDSKRIICLSIKTNKDMLDLFYTCYFNFCQRIWQMQYTKKIGKYYKSYLLFL